MCGYSWEGGRKGWSLAGYPGVSLDLVPPMNELVVISSRSLTNEPKTGGKSSGG